MRSTLHRLVIPGLIAASVCAAIACVETEPVGAARHEDDAVSFTHDIAPILRTHCIRCHGQGSAKGDFSIDSREQMLAAAGIVTPGDAATSRLIELVSGGDPLLTMPPEGEPLTADQVALLARWVDEGAVWDGPLAAGVARARPITPRNVEVPEAHDGIEHPIDLILDAYFHARGISPAPVVGDAVYLRRLKLDVLGLLPTREEVTAFTASDDPEKRTNIAQRLLDDRRNYAEHWLTFWNDLLRNDYSGTGYIDGGRTQITQWLYESLRENTPYDRFVAALVNPTRDSAGFANGIKWRGEVNASQRRELQYAQNVSQVFLGINMKCASCHDSFVDGWKLADAYGMAAIIADEPLELHRCDNPIGEFARASFPFAELGQIDADASRADRLAQFAALLTNPDNGRLARTIVNRIWQRLMGRALVEPVDEMAGPAWNEDLLDLLANHLREHGYDMKAVIEFIVTSEAYQRDAVAVEDDRADGEAFTFHGPSPQRMTAEQYLDAVWTITGAGPGQAATPVAMDEPQAKWIWSTADASAGRPAGEEIEFAHALILPQVPVEAHAVITCDNEYTLSINGTVIGADETWQTVETYDIAQHLQDGGNDVRIIARNAGQGPNPAGMFFEAVLTFEDGTQRHVSSNEIWVWTEHPQTGEHGRADAWPQAEIVATQRFLGDDINARLAAAVAAFSKHELYVRASLVDADRLMRTLGRPSRDQVVTTRPSELSTLQALELTNGEIMTETLNRGAAMLADRFDTTDALVKHIYTSALAREPSAVEAQLAGELLGEQPSREAIADFLWAVFMLPEFQMIRMDGGRDMEVHP